MTQSNTYSPNGQKYLLSPRGVMEIEVPQNGFLEEEKMEGKEESAFRRRRTNRGSINIKK